MPVAYIYGNDYYIADPEKACVGSAKMQLGLLLNLLGNGAVKTEAGGNRVIPLCLGVFFFLFLEVLEKSPIEVESTCPHFGQCGGCTYQNLPYKEQVKMKEVQIKEKCYSNYSYLHFFNSTYYIICCII